VHVSGGEQLFGGGSLQLCVCARRCCNYALGGITVLFVLSLLLLSECIAVAIRVHRCQQINCSVHVVNSQEASVPYMWLHVQKSSYYCSTTTGCAFHYCTPYLSTCNPPQSHALYFEPIDDCSGHCILLTTGSDMRCPCSCRPSDHSLLAGTRMIWIRSLCRLQCLSGVISSWPTSLDDELRIDNLLVQPTRREAA
jgi:hypothetical protein